MNFASRRSRDRTHSKRRTGYFDLREVRWRWEWPAIPQTRVLQRGLLLCVVLLRLSRQATRRTPSLLLSLRLRLDRPSGCWGYRKDTRMSETVRHWGRDGSTTDADPEVGKPCPM